MLHFEKANYVAKIWKSDLNSIVSEPEIYENRWTVIGDIWWIEQIFADNIEDTLIDDEYENLTTLKAT